MPTFSATPFVAAIVALLSFALLARLVFADVGASASFKSNQSINDFGGGSTSTSFTAVTTGGQFVTGQSTSSNFQLSTGYEYFDSFAPKQENWRWYDDETNETPTDSLEVENVAPSNIQNGNSIKLRAVVAETAAIGESNVKFKLQFSTVSDFSSAVHNVVESTSCGGSSVWCYASGAGADNSVISTALITGADSCSAGVGDGCGTHNVTGTATSTFTQKKNTIAEYEFTVQSSGTAAATAYFFRLWDTDANVAVPLQTGATYPSLVSGGSTLSFSISGIASSTMTGGVTTNIDTTATDIPFGTLPIGTPITAAQQLAVSTNAATGYEVYAYQEQGFLGENAQIDPVLGTNASPIAWSIGCMATSAGCFGYHTDETVLAGGSIRFAPDDTYAGFTSNLSEVAYSATPVTNKTTDVVYKVEAHNLQAAGAYSTSVAYIIVPVF